MLRLDNVTREEHDAASAADARALAIFDALIEPVSINVYNGNDVLVGSGTLDTPWAILIGSTLTVNAVTEFSVTTTAVPDGGWYLRIEAGDRYVQGTFGLAGQARDFTWSLSSWEVGQSGVIGTVVITTQAEGDPEFLAIPTVSAVQGQSASVSLRWFVRSALELPFDWVTQGTLPPGWSLTADGYLNYDGVGVVGNADISVVATEFSEPEPTGTTRFADVPEQIFVSGYAEDEELGIYILDPANRTVRGDLWWQTGTRLQRILEQGGGPWAPSETITLTVTSGTLPEGLEFDAATARLRYDGTPIVGATHDCTVTLSAGTESTSFRIRTLQPTVIYTANPGSLPASYAGVPTFAPAATPWSTVRASGTSGTDDSTPRVILFGDELIPRRDWFIGNADTVAKYRHMYLLGTPGGATQLGLPYSSQTGTMEQFVNQRFQALHFKNMKFGNLGIQTQTNESSLPTRWTIQKIDFLDRNPNSLNSVANAAGWEPSPYPSAVNDYRFHCVNMRMYEGGANGNTEHCFYIETNGYTFGDWNNVQMNGSHACSLIQTVLGHVRVRNSYLAGTSDEADPTSRPTSATEMLDCHALGEVVAYNNTFVGHNDNVGNGGTQNGHMSTMQNRRPAKGSNTPQYPSTSWNPSGHGVGPDSPRLGTFPVGTDTFVNNSFWAAAAAGGTSNMANPYLFRKFFACNTVRAVGTLTNQPIRVDGSHPTEQRIQLASDTRMLGTHPDWFERCVIGFVNNDFQSWASTSRIVENRRSQNITFVEDGTKMVSYNVTLSDGQAGVVRVQIATDALCDATPNVKALTGWVALTPVPETWTELRNNYLLTPSSYAENPTRWPAAKWPATATGSGPHTEIDSADPLYTTRVVDVGGNSYSDVVGAPPVEVPSWFLI